MTLEFRLKYHLIGKGKGEYRPPRGESVIFRQDEWDLGRK